MTEDRRTDTAVAYTAVALQAVRTRCKNNRLRSSAKQCVFSSNSSSSESRDPATVKDRLRSYSDLCKFVDVFGGSSGKLAGQAVLEPSKLERPAQLIFIALLHWQTVKMLHDGRDGHRCQLSFTVPWAACLSITSTYLKGSYKNAKSGAKPKNVA